MRDVGRYLGRGRHLCAGLALVGSAALLSTPMWGKAPADQAQSPQTQPASNNLNKQANPAPTRDPLAVELEERLANDVRPLLEQYCYACHGNGRSRGDVALDGPGAINNIMAMADDWLAAVAMLNAGLMPPEDEPQPTAHQILTIQQWVADATDYYPADAEPDPGWYTIHRLNRSEYRNTMRDLLGIDPARYDLASHLPDDDTGYGFDNIADVLSMSPLQLEGYLDAAEHAIDLALGPNTDPTPRPLRSLERNTIGDELASGGQAIWANGTVWGGHTFTHDGEYEITVRAYGDFARGVGPRITVSLAQDVLETVDITARQGQAAQVITLRTEVQAGRRRITVEFINDEVVNGQDRNLYIESITVAGPFRDDAGREAYDAIFFITPTADDEGNRLPGVEGGRRISESMAARQVIERFATRAFRRPADVGEVGALMRLYQSAREQGDSYESAVKLALTATLVSPNFLYRAISNPQPNNAEFIYTLSDLELATRLSYFLWSSMPDDRLMDLAQAGRLSNPDVLRGQVRRMLMDPRSSALVENFAGQWLLLRGLDGVQMDPERFPAFDDELREAMRTEAELFFADVLRENRSVLEFIDSDRTFLNQTLAEHYRIGGVRGDNFRLVELPFDSPRGGVLTMAATLTVTSHATRTSPVKRGDYVLSQLMGTAPPPPPPDVPPLEQAGETLGENATLREQLALHVADPNCAVCHRRLDPIGLAMENFNAIGVWRDTEQGRLIDATGELPGGVMFNGPIELKRVMLGQHDQFVNNLSRKMLTYAIGRGSEPFDRPTIQQIARAVNSDRYRMQTLIEAVVLSDAFLQARGREPQP